MVLLAIVEGFTMDRIIKVTGNGRISVKPDLTRVEMILSDSRPTYDAVVKLSTAMTELLRISLSKIGFDKKDIRTEFFDISPYYEDYMDDKDEHKQRFLGHKYTHGMRLEFPNDSKLLGQCIKAIASCPAKPEFKVSYTIKDTESLKNLIIGKAVADARKKAEVLSQAAGISLGSIQTMEYNWDDIQVISNTDIALSDELYDNESSNFKLNIEPEDVEATDTVTVIWSIL